MRFCFYSGAKDSKDGYSKLIITLSEALINQGKKVIIFNFKDGLIAKELSDVNENLTIIDINSTPESKLKDFINQDDILIITRFLYPFSHFMSKNPKIIYYDINDQITSICDYNYGIQLRSYAKRLIRKLLEAKSLFFMDDTGIFNLKKELKIDVNNPVFLPIPIRVPDENFFLKRNHNNQKTLTISYLGRSVDWKMMPLKKILDDYLELSSSNQVEFIIIVDSIKNLQKFISIEKYKAIKGIKITLFENISLSNISELLLSYSDLHFGMGTSALEGAKLGIPTILLDYSKESFPKDYTYSWLYKSEFYCLGKNLDKRPVAQGIKLRDIIQDVYRDVQKIESESKQCYSYVKHTFDSRSIAVKLIEGAERASFRLKDSESLILFYFPFHKFLKNIKNAITGQ